MFYEVIPEGKLEALTYNYDTDKASVNDIDGSLLPGQIVTAPVGRRIVPGIVVKKVAQPDFKTKPINKVLYSKPLPAQLLAATKFIHEYYLASSGQAVSLILPRGVEKKRRSSSKLMLSSVNAPKTTQKDQARSQVADKNAVSTQNFTPERNKTEQMFGSSSLDRPGRAFSSSKIDDNPLNPPPSLLPTRTISFELPTIQLNSAQENALKGLQEAPGTTKVLFGVTGSGKTNIYLKLAQNALKDHKSTILLVPEIALTGQLVQVFGEVFGNSVVMIHSKQTEAERHLIFERILLSKEPLVVIGPRSALFAPLSNLGLIIIDEEHEMTYFQENAPKYSAIRVASFIAKQVNCPLILGSATPSIEDYYLASKRGATIELLEKAKTTAIKPNIKIIDFKDRDAFSKNRYYSNGLLAAIKRNVALKRQTLIFHNRRGSSPLTLCENCGEEILCPNCFLPLTLHADEFTLHCHTCGFSEKVPLVCPKCKTPGLIHKGFGTKLLESELCRLFPEARIKRFDADNKKGEGLDTLYETVKYGEVDIIIGTQTIAKGLDLPKLATVGVVQADAGLSLPDYMAEERVFQLLTQVIGRVGRGHLNEAEVFIQTYRPEHPVLKFATEEDYKGFYKYLIKKRQESGFPPYRFVAKIEITMKTESIVLRKIRALAKEIALNPKLVASPPCPAFHERTARGYTWQIIIRSRSRKALTETCAGLDQSFKITLDPPGLL